MSRSLLALLMLSLLSATSLIAADPGVFNVRDFGAIGDGKVDDTAAFQAAIDKAKAAPRGSSVYVPAGEYRITKTINVENVLVTGMPAGGWPADNGPQPTIKVDFQSGPCFKMGAASSLNGLRMAYDHKGKVIPYPAAVLLTGNGISVTNMQINAPYDGIIADGVSNIGRLNIENVFIPACYHLGVYVTRTYDIPTLRNIEVWNPPDYSLDHCIGFKFGRNDEIRIDNCFAFKCKIGFLFSSEDDGNTWGGMNNCSVDYSVEGVVVEGPARLRINGGCLWAHSTSLRVDGKGAKVIVSGCDMKSNGAPVMIVKQCESLSVTGCQLGKSGPDWPNVPAATISGGTNILINGCDFDNNGPGLVIEGGEHISVTGNIFEASPFDAITDKTPETTSKMIKDNLSKKTAEVKKTEERKKP